MKRFLVPWFCVLSSALLYAAGDLAADPPRGSVESHVRITVDRERKAGLTELVIQVGVPESARIEVFTIPDPARIVLDAIGARVRRPSSFPVKDSAVIGQLRVGVHPDKFRLVIDLLNPTIPKFTWNKGKKGVTIRIQEGAGGATIPQATPAALGTETVAPSPTTSTPTATKTHTPTRSPARTPTMSKTIAASTPMEEPTVAAPTSMPAPTATRTPTPSPTPTLTPMPRPTTPRPSPSPSATRTRTVEVEIPSPTPEILPSEPEQSAEVDGSPKKWSLVEYRFELVEPGAVPIIKLRLNHPRAAVQTVKVDSETYRIVIADCIVGGPHLLLPQFPPGNFEGFSSLETRQTDRGVEIIVKVSPNTTIGSFVRNDEVWLKRM